MKVNRSYKLRLYGNFVCSSSSCSKYLREADADLNAAKVLRNRGHLVVEKYFSSALRGV